MAGAKGRSGKNPRHELFRLKELSDKSVDWCINNFSKLSDSDKLKVVTSIAVRFIPQDINVKEDVSLKVIVRHVDIEDRLSLLGFN